MHDHHSHSTTHATLAMPAANSEATSTEVVVLRHGGVYHLRAGRVRRRIGDAMVEMLAYNGSIPGPTLQVPQGAEITVHFTNETEFETTVHWHGVRVDNRFDGVPHDTQAPVQAKSSFTYRLRFPDAGIYWYHPHMYEDYAQEMGLYGNIVVTPSESNYWPPVNCEVALLLDDILMEEGKIAPFDHSGMERLGNVLLLNGESGGVLRAKRGEVVRLHLTNAANARNFNVGIPGARLKVIGGDSGRVEHEQIVDKILLSPSERATVDVLFEEAGEFPIEHSAKSRSYRFGTFVVSEASIESGLAAKFYTLRHDPELTALRGAIHAHFDRAPDKTLVLRGDMPGMSRDGSHGGGHGNLHHGDIEHTMPAMGQLAWKIVDQATDQVNHAIHWTFNAGEQVKIRIVNDPQVDHPMAHPMHFHGERFLVLQRDGVRNDNLAWKDTVLVNTGETIDILLDASNAGSWMAHCHIAEHNEGGMMFTFQVQSDQAETFDRHTAHAN